MRLRRVRGTAALETQYLDGDAWRPLPGVPPWGPSPFTADWELATADRHQHRSGHSGALLPFSPLSFRDFLLSEQHNIAAARGMLRRFYPASFRATAAFERLTGRSFPAFRPARLFYRQPIYYMSNAMTIVPSGTPVAFPGYTRGLDFELEVAFVLGAPLLDASPAEAEAAVAAFVLLNDFSARDVQRDEMASGLGPQKSKHFLSSMSATAAAGRTVRVGHPGRRLGHGDRTVAERRRHAAAGARRHR